MDAVHRTQQIHNILTLRQSQRAIK